VSKIALTPNASGTGTFTLAAPNSNTSRTITLPDEAGEVLVNTATGINVTGGVTTNAYSYLNGLRISGGDTGNTVYQPSGDLSISSASGSISLKPSGTNILHATNTGINVTGSVTLDNYSGNSGRGRISIGNSGQQYIEGYDTGNAGSGSYLSFGQGASERMRIDNSGTLLVGTTDSAGTRYSATSGGGTVIQPSSYSVFSRETTASNQAIMTINNTGVDAIFTEFLKDGTTVGSIKSNSGARLAVNSEGNFGMLQVSNNTCFFWSNTSLSPFNDNVRDLGEVSFRYDDIYATNGTIQTSDRNEKQDIEVLSDAETRVAQACKGLLRKFRWQDAVAEKGDDARIHFGIIAQDLQDAFAAEGLDAGRYAMFISSTWWETQNVVIPAVLDEEGNELEAERTEQQLVTEAVEAKDAYTRTDTYETQAEAPEGATERTRLGVRYPELLAFIIGAM